MQHCLIQQVSGLWRLIEIITKLKIYNYAYSFVYLRYLCSFDLNLDAFNYQNFPQGPQSQNYGTYPGAFAQQQQQPPPQQGGPGGYPHQGYPHAPQWPPQQ